MKKNIKSFLCLMLCAISITGCTNNINESSNNETEMMQTTTTSAEIKSESDTTRVTDVSEQMSPYNQPRYICVDGKNITLLDEYVVTDFTNVDACEFYIEQNDDILNYIGYQINGNNLTILLLNRNYRTSEYSDKYYIYSVVAKENAYTDKGIAIGDTKAKVIDVYGEPFATSDKAQYIDELGRTTSFAFDDKDKVISIHIDCRPERLRDSNSVF